ncbi:MAG: HEAT repeat domain-containing protein [Thermacetogeniaceae bacterium]
MVVKSIREIEERLNSSDEEERANAVLDLGGVDDPERVEKLIEILESNKSRFVREAAAVSLISTGTKTVAGEVLAELLRDPDPGVCNLAVKVICVFLSNSYARLS